MIFIDTGAFIARYRRSDQWHQEALRGWEDIERKQMACVTTNLVLAEAAQLLGRMVGNVQTAQRLRIWLSSERLKVLHPDADQELDAADLMKRYADQAIGFVDCLSFVVMRQLNVSAAFSFDRHFRTAGFALWRALGRS
jgi:predicted nucleic acid-binding protein